LIFSDGFLLLKFLHAKSSVKNMSSLVMGLLYRFIWEKNPRNAPQNHTEL